MQKNTSGNALQSEICHCQYPAPNKLQIVSRLQENPSYFSLFQDHSLFFIKTIHTFVSIDQTAVRWHISTLKGVRNGLEKDKKTIKNNDKMIKTVKHYVQPDVRNLMGLESGSPLCTSDPQPGEAGNYDSNDDIIYDDIF